LKFEKETQERELMDNLNGALMKIEELEEKLD